MNDMRLQILLEHLNLICRYYEDERCERAKTYKFANCGGELKACDLTKEEIRI